MTAKRERTSTGARGRLGAGLELRGRLDGRGDLELEGRLVGGLDVAGEVRVAPGGRIEAQGDDPPAPLRARSLRVAGLIVGDVQGEDV
ncbi:MAG: polymer-forming cytoskeletal protein, partial [Myxococcota bacterium]